jgi:hypothetical protein
MVLLAVLLRGARESDAGDLAVSSAHDWHTRSGKLSPHFPCKFGEKSMLSWEFKINRR